MTNMHSDNRKKSKMLFFLALKIILYQTCN